MKSGSVQRGNDIKSVLKGDLRKRCKLFDESNHMINTKKIVVVMPAYNAEKTLEKTFNEIPFDIVDEVIIVDDFSNDNTLAEAQKLGIQHVIVHEKNKGYGANQKTCYKKALDLGADIVIMLHPDYQYTPKLIHSIAYLISNGLYPVVLGSRILGKGALKGGMPYYKYMANRFLTAFQNILIDAKLSEYHTGYRAYSRDVLEAINFEENSDDFVFDNELLSQILYAGFEIAEITCPTKYFAEASSINFGRSVRYGFGVLRVSIGHFLQRRGLIQLSLYQPKRRHAAR
jgi:glycosyltransferase involved in cell wall biosynthesis